MDLKKKKKKTLKSLEQSIDTFILRADQCPRGIFVTADRQKFMGYSHETMEYKSHNNKRLILKTDTSHNRWDKQENREKNKINKKS